MPEADNLLACGGRINKTLSNERKRPKLNDENFFESKEIKIQKIEKQNSQLVHKLEESEKQMKSQEKKIIELERKLLDFQTFQREITGKIDSQGERIHSLELGRDRMATEVTRNKQCLNNLAMDVEKLQPYTGMG